MIENKFTMVELFSGIGAQERALRQLGLPYEIKHTCDCDKETVLSYAAMRYDLEKEIEVFDFPSKETMVEELQAKNLGYDFEKGKHTITMKTNIDKVKQYYIADKLTKNLGDIGKVERLPYADMVTYSFPCTDLSVAGKGEGMVNKCECGHTWDIDFSDANNDTCRACGKRVQKSTRSGLLGQVQRLISVAQEENTLPKYLLMENVKNLIGKKFKPQFDSWVAWLDSVGYNTYYQVLNAKYYGIPQNRERIFAISIRKDVDTKGFIFPETIPLTTRLKDVLEKNINEKYYLPDERIEKILSSTFAQEKKRIQTTDVYDVCEPQVVIGSMQANSYIGDGTISPSLTAAMGMGGGQIPMVGYIKPIIYDDYNSRISADQDAINTLTCNCGASAERNGVKIIEPVIVDAIYNNRPARIYDQAAPTLRSERFGLEVIEPKDLPCSTRGSQIASTIRASIYKQGARNLEQNVINGLGYEGVIEQGDPQIKWRIRKLTPKETWRLMGFTDQDADKSAQFVSASAQYKQAGNSICTSCLIALFSSLLIKDGHRADVWSKYLIHYFDKKFKKVP